MLALSNEPTGANMRRPIAVIFALAAALPACTGAVGSDSSGGAAGSSSSGGPGSGAGAASEGMGPARPGATMLRRLTNREYRNTLQALLSLPTAPKDALGSDPLSKAGFDNFASQLIVSPTIAAEYAANASALIEGWQAPACAQQESDCARDFVTAFGKKAFRRPLLQEEINRYTALFADERTRSDYPSSIAQVMETMLQSPKFLYRTELGSASDGTQRRLTSHEVASALSYLFTASMPDDELFAAADANALQTPSEIEAQARRLLTLPAARVALRDFIFFYAGITRLSEIIKNADAYPEFSAALQAAMQEESRQFVDAVLWDGSGTFKSLMTEPSTFVNGDLAALYGLPPPSDASSFVKATPPHRAGLLTQPSVLAAHSKADQSFPILRGKFLRVGVLCQNLPAPPQTVPEAPEPTPNATTRERFAQHSSDPACSGCHTLIDPLGFAFENYDGIGKYRDTENGKPIDASAEVTSTLGLDGKYVGAVELANKVAGSIDAQQCFALQAFRWTFGRYDAGDEANLANELQKDLGADGLDIKELFVRLVKSDVFMSRTFD